jgi:ADP-heptose:LPS heptosyltransferase
MTFLQYIEAALRPVGYGILRLIFHNAPAVLPLQFSPDATPRVLLFRYDRIGDMIVTTPMIDLLHERLPNAEIHVLASPRNASLLRHDTRVAAVYEFDGTISQFEALRNLFPLRKQLGSLRFDVIFSLVSHKTTFGGLVANILGGSEAVKVGLGYPTRNGLYSTLYNALTQTEFDGETIAEAQVRQMCMVFGWEYSSAIVRYSVQLSAENEARAERILSAIPAHSTSLVLYNISAGKPKHRWSPERNSECLRRLTQCFPGAHFVVNAAPNDAADAAELQRQFPTRLSVLPATNDLLDVCAVVKRVQAVISPDTSIIHIASMYRKPLVGMYPRVSYHAQWLPFGDFPYRVVLTEGEEPVEAIEPERVVAAFGEIMEVGSLRSA